MDTSINNLGEDLANQLCQLSITDNHRLLQQQREHDDKANKMIEHIYWLESWKNSVLHNLTMSDIRPGEKEAALAEIEFIQKMIDMEYDELFSL